MGDFSNQDIIEAIVAEWKTPLGLSDWRIVAKYGGVHDKHMMAVVFDEGARTATIRVFENWRDKLDDDWGYSLEEGLLHELLHLVVEERMGMDKEIADWFCNRFAVLLRNAERKGKAEGRRQLERKKTYQSS